MVGSGDGGERVWLLVTGGRSDGGGERLRFWGLKEMVVGGGW